MGLMFGGCAIAAVFWERSIVFRIAPLIAALLIALMVIAFHEVEPTLAGYAEVLLGFLFGGAILNFAIWIQCRHTNDDSF